MNDTLNSIFVRLDVSLQNLSSKAIAQIIVKLLYKHDGRMKKQAIYDALAKVNSCNHLGKKDVDEILDKLSEREIQHKGGDYYLSHSKKEKRLFVNLVEKFDNPSLTPMSINLFCLVKILDWLHYI